MTISKDHIELGSNVRGTSKRAYVIPFLAMGSLIVSIGSLYYSAKQIEILRQQNENSHQQIEILRQQNEYSHYNANQQNDLIGRQTRLLEMNRNAFLSARFDVVQSPSKEVQLIIENTGVLAVEIKNIQIDGISIFKHPLLEPKQFNIDPQNLQPIFLHQGVPLSYLTVASAPTSRTTSQSVVLPAVTIIFDVYFVDQEGQENVYHSIQLQAGFSRKLVFPDKYIQWQELRSSILSGKNAGM